MTPRVLVVAPHPDDETLGCGGTIQHHRNLGHAVEILFLTSGENGSRDRSASECAAIRMKEATRAMRALGINEEKITFLDLGDGRIDHRAVEQFIAMLREIRSKRPHVLYVTHAREASHDHQEACALIWRSAEMAQSNNYPTVGTTAWRIPVILGYEVWTPIEAFEFAIDITPYAKRKASALACYTSQSRKVKGQASYASKDGLSLSRFRGTMIRGGFTEAFKVMRADTLFSGLAKARA